MLRHIGYRIDCSSTDGLYLVDGHRSHHGDDNPLEGIEIADDIVQTLVQCIDSLAEHPVNTGTFDKLGKCVFQPVDTELQTCGINLARSHLVEFIGELRKDILGRKFSL